MKAIISTQKQTFSFNAPTAASVLLAGDFTQWQKHPIALTKQADGVWRATTSLAPGTYHYRFLVDGEWRDDPSCTLRVGNPFGSQDAVLVVSHASAARVEKLASTRQKYLAKRVGFCKPKRSQRDISV